MRQERKYHVNEGLEKGEDKEALQNQQNAESMSIYIDNINTDMNNVFNKNVFKYKI